MEMTPERWAYIERYNRALFGRCDAHLAGLPEAASAEGIPDIAVSAEVGRLLQLLVSTTPGRLAIEVGTLAGFSGIWIARGLAPDGRLITVEADPMHADFAARQFDTAGVGERVTIERGAALDVLPRLATEHGPDSVDVVFLDAVKTEYPAYWRIVRPMIRTGGWLLADNVLGSNWTIDDEANETRQAVDGFNRSVADDAAFESVIVPMRNGVLAARRVQ